MKVVTDGVEIIIATPGRLNDLIEAGCVKVESVTYLVLDEVSSYMLIGFDIDKMIYI
jgi:ATP-dependent RNA helicase DDX43